MELPLFGRVVDSVSAAVSAHLNAEIVVTGCHPEADAARRRSPVPLIQLFLDSEDLLVEGGSMSDMSAFL